MTRRRFAFWIGLMMFWFSRRLHAGIIDKAAASLMEWSEDAEFSYSRRDRWRPNANRKWKWFERETFIDGEWKRSGVTTPIERTTGARYAGATGYLDDTLVPESVYQSTTILWKKLAAGRSQPSAEITEGQPPSQWLRSLNANELRLWLRTIRLPEVGVVKMTFWTHLTRDHEFESERIRGLTTKELAKLHSAAHYGF